MRIEYLQYFLEVCRTKSMSTAARNLHVAQQTVSMAVKALEDEWNLTLLERTNRGVSVTAAGEYVAEEASRSWCTISTSASTARPTSPPPRLPLCAAPSL